MLFNPDDLITEFIIHSAVVNSSIGTLLLPTDQMKVRIRESYTNTLPSNPRRNGKSKGTIIRCSTRTKTLALDGEKSKARRTFEWTKLNAMKSFHYLFVYRDNWEFIHEGIARREFFHRNRTSELHLRPTRRRLRAKKKASEVDEKIPARLLPPRRLCAVSFLSKAPRAVNFLLFYLSRSSRARARASSEGRTFVPSVLRILNFAPRPPPPASQPGELRCKLRLAARGRKREEEEAARAGQIYMQLHGNTILECARKIRDYKPPGA